MREESFSAPGYKTGSDTYVLNRFRAGLSLIPAKWLKFRFQTQDARVFWKQAVLLDHLRRKGCTLAREGSRTRSSRILQLARGLRCRVTVRSTTGLRARYVNSLGLRRFASARASVRNLGGR